jgi:hypothetical protein
MGGRDNQAELTARKPGIRSTKVSHQFRFRLRWCLRIAAMLCLAVVALDDLSERVLGQAAPPLNWARTITIEVAKPLTQLLHYRLSVKTPPADTEIDFKGDGTEWRFVQFEQLPEKVAVRVNGQLLGYKEAEPLQPKKWYSFKDTLSVILEVKPDAQMPVDIVVLYGSPDSTAGQNFLKDPTLKADDVRRFPDNNPMKESGRQSLKFEWEAQAQPTVSTAVTPAPEPSWWQRLFDDALFGSIILFFAVCLVALVVWVGVSQVRKRIQHRQDRKYWERQNQSQLAKPKKKEGQKRAPLPTKAATDAGMYDSLGGEAAQLAESRVRTEWEVAEEPRQQSSSRQGSHREYDWPQEDNHLPSSGSPKKAALTVSQDGKKLSELEGKMNQLEMMLREKVDRQENLTPAARANVENLILQSEKSIRAHMETKLKQSASEAVEPLEQLMNGQALSVKAEFEKTSSRITHVSGEEEKTKKQLGEVISEMRQVETRFQARLVELQTAVDRRTVPDSFYARTIGAILGQHIEALQDGNFEKLMVEQLNQFFQTDVARGERLQELRGRAERISDAIKEVLVPMERLNPRETVEARPKMQSVEALLTDLIGLLAQLQTRRATVETTLRIPVSMYAGARQTFLDELGRGIRREIEKLKDPENYFESELSRVITTEVISIVDICDKKIASAPGNQPELEGTLKRLFEEAGLRSILPRPGEPFKTAEQDLIEMDKGAGPSMTVAHVITRGFYFMHRDNETLLRKAGVAVYR